MKTLWLFSVPVYLACASCAQDGSASACDAVTEATASSATSCSSTPRVNRCSLYTGGPLSSPTGAVIGCDSSWKCPEGKLGFVCDAVGAGFECQCRKAGVDTFAFTWTGDPCSRENVAVNVARAECQWDVP